MSMRMSSRRKLQEARLTRIATKRWKSSQREISASKGPGTYVGHCSAGSYTVALGFKCVLCRYHEPLGYCAIFSKCPERDGGIS